MWDNKWKELLQEVNTKGNLVSRVDDDNYIEIIGHKFTLENPRDRLIPDSIRPLNIIQAIGQFLWITQGSFNLEAIKYYQPIADKFSSDGWKMIGAYGPRLFGVHHLNQIKHALETLHEDKLKRRAIASVYLPQFDQHKKSDEVPCTLNLQYLVRDDKLHAVTYMRSQNTYGLLPLDVFIFTMLQEYVGAYLQAEYELELGTYHHLSGSFHVYTKNKSEIDQIIKNKSSFQEIMKPMPFKDVEMNINKLNQFEKTLRTTVKAHEKKKLPVDFNFFLEMIDDLPKDEYWKQLALILIWYGAHNSNDKTNCDKFFSMLNPIYQFYIKLWLQHYANK